MATVTGLTSARMIAIEGASVVSGTVNGSGDLVLTKHNGSTINAGNVMGPVGPTSFASGTVAMSAGTIVEWATNTAPSGWLFCNGASYDKTNTLYTDLFNIIGYTYGGAGNNFNVPDLRGKTTVGVEPAVSKGTATISIASPAVITRTAHGLAPGQIVTFSTLGSLPTGIVAGTKYYVFTATANTFTISSLSLPGTVINTSGTQSGFHTLYSSNFDLATSNGTTSQAAVLGDGSFARIGIGTPAGAARIFIDVAADTTNWTPENYGTITSVQTTDPGGTKSSKTALGGSTDTANNLPPYLALNYIIKYVKSDGLAATVTVGTTTTLAPGTPGTVTNSGSLSDAVFNFALPSGPTGPAGSNGTDTIPAGFIAEWPNATAPTNWVFCQGQALSRLTYASLFSAIGTTYGVGDGTSTFNVPNFQDRAPLGASATRALGVAGGSETHAHALSDAGQAKIDASAGTIRLGRGGTISWTRNRTATASTADSTATESAGVGLIGSTDSGSTLQPYLPIHFIIKTSNGDSPGDSQLTTRVSTLENGFRLVQTVPFTSGGNFTKITYPWLKAVKVKVVGGGGAGGGAPATSAGNHADGGGGGGGGYAEKLILVSSLAASVLVTVGAGGTGGTSTGGAGGASSFGADVVASGGGGGTVGTNSALAIGAQGGANGVGTAGDLLLSGSEGGVSSGNATLPRSGQGGNSVMGGGGGGVYVGSTGGRVAGATGKQYGGGGAGAGNAQSATSASNGGSGASGIVLVELYA